MPYRYKQPADWKATRLRILERDGHRCYRCAGLATQVDHVVNEAAGGTHDDSNLAAICEQCHRRKSATEAAVGRARRSGKRAPERHPGLL